MKMSQCAGGLPLPYDLYRNLNCMPRLPRLPRLLQYSYIPGIETTWVEVFLLKSIVWDSHLMVFVGARETSDREALN